MSKVGIMFLVGVALTLLGQTRVNLKNQGTGVDFANLPTTRPFKTGVALPATCSVGEMFFNSGAPAGQNLVGCTAPNVWTLQSGSSAGGSVPFVAGPSGALDCTTVAGQCDVVPALVPFKYLANAYFGANDFTASPYVAIPVGAPGSSNAQCTKGTIEFDPAFIYVCVAPNAWRRSPLVLW